MKKTQIKLLDKTDQERWDRFVRRSPHSSHYHLYGWRKVIESVYRLKTYYLAAVDSIDGSCSKIRGIMPLVHVKKPLSGDRLVSTAFFDEGGILAADNETEGYLLRHALELAEQLNVKMIELRHSFPLPILEDLFSEKTSDNITEYEDYLIQRLSYKVGLDRRLPESSEFLMESFPSKLRSQIKKPIKLGLTTTIGGAEMINDFYTVFSTNMRDLGSPTHSKRLYTKLTEVFSDNVRFLVAYYQNHPVAGSVLIRYKDELKNPWASSLRRYRYLDGNMLLYWSMLKTACDEGLRRFDFGRSSPEAGTCKFKLQWGAKATPLIWYNIVLKDGFKTPLKESLAFDLWKKLPLTIANWLGPIARKQISL